jgi:hypothetical protein
MPGDPSLFPNVVSAAGGATQQTAFNTGAASVITLTLNSAAGVTLYLSGILVTGLGATAAAQITVAITGLASALTLYYPVPAGATVSGPVLFVPFSSPLPASAANTNIVVTVASFGAGNTAAGASAWGFRV